MEQAAVTEWLSAYALAWASYDPAAIADLFSEDAAYSFGPFLEPVHGRDAIVASWLKDRDPAGTYEGSYRPIALDGSLAVANGRSRYYKDASRTELLREYDNVFVVRFDKDGKCTSFAEWYMGRPKQVEP